MIVRFLGQALAAGMLVDGIRSLRRHAALSRRLFGLAEVSLGFIVLYRIPITVPALYRVGAYVYDPISRFYRGRQFPTIHQAFDQTLTTFVTPETQILDLGCGTAANLERLRALQLPFGSYIGVDLTGAMLARASAKFADQPHVSFVHLNLLTDPLPEGPFDLILSTWVFEHLPDPIPVVVKAFERLRPDGHAVFLFLADTGTWYAPLVQRFLHLFSARLVSDDVVQQFPGLAARDHFASGSQTMVILAKENAVWSRALET